MGIDKDQIRDLIRRTLKEADDVIPYSEDAVELLMLTAAQESHLGTYIKQIRGPALGVFQMEPATHDDIWGNYLIFKKQLASYVGLYVGYRYSTKSADLPSPVKSEALEANLVYAILMARVHYRRVPAALPPRDDIEAMATYWKRYYNTPEGRGQVGEAEFNYRELCL